MNFVGIVDRPPAIRFKGAATQLSISVRYLIGTTRERFP
jgi:hypothetical protein